MLHLDTRVRLTLEEDYNAGDLFARIDWSVQQDLSLDGADAKQVREYATLNLYLCKECYKLTL
jgi:hypothetical protein